MQSVSVNYKINQDTACVIRYEMMKRWRERNSIYERERANNCNVPSQNLYRIILLSIRENIIYKCAAFVMKLLIFRAAN